MYQASTQQNWEGLDFLNLSNKIGGIPLYTKFVAIKALLIVVISALTDLDRLKSVMSIRAVNKRWKTGGFNGEMSGEKKKHHQKLDGTSDE